MVNTAVPGVGAPPTPARLTSPKSPRVNAARRLHKRAARCETRRFLAEGPQAVREALRAGGVLELFLTPGTAARYPQFIAQAQALAAPVAMVDEPAAAALGQTVTPQGVVALCTALDVPLEQVVSGASAVQQVVILAAVRDPGNAGTLLRSADAAGADAVIFSDSSVDPYNGKCVRASAGSLWHVPVVTGVTVAQAVQHCRDNGLQVLAADGHGEHDLDSLAQQGRLAQPTAWILGNEAWGLPEPVVQLADAAVRVPIYGQAESLNVASAATLCLYATAQARRQAASEKRKCGNENE